MNEIIENQSIDIFKALAHPTRLNIVKLLTKRPYNVCSIVDKLQLQQANISQHLCVLKKAGIIKCSKCGMKVTYEISMHEISDIINMVEKYLINKLRERSEQLNNYL